jgi:transposase
MSTNQSLPNNSSRRLTVTVVDAAPGTIVVAGDDPWTAAIQVPVIQVPVNQLLEEERQARAARVTPTPTAIPVNANTPPPAPSPLPPLTTSLGGGDTPLPSDVAVLQRMIRELLDSLKKASRDREALQQRIDLLLRRLYGQKSERFDPNQPWLIAEMAPNHDDSSQEPTAKPADLDDADQPSQPKKNANRGRKPLPKDLPRERTEHKLSEAERLCPHCGVVCQQFGEDIREQLDYHPASLFVRQHVYCKYACQSCHDHVTVAPPAPAIIDRGLPGAGLLAQITVSKYADHLPLHRLERIMGRHGVELNRSTLCNWMAHVAATFKPVVDLMALQVRQSKVVHTDATKMPYLDPNMPGKTLSGQMWDYVGDRDHPYNVFDFCANHSASGIDAFLKDNHYQGYLNADALNIYDHLFHSGKVIEVGCWAHCRRKFFDAKESDPGRAHLVLARIRQLYAVEAKAKAIIAEQKLGDGEADALRVKLRQDESLLEITSMREWLAAEQLKVLPKSLIGQAIAYALRHWEALTRYLAHGFLAIDNNIAELTLRHIAIGRKNWLFAGNAKGAQTAAVLFSVTSSCARHKVDVFAYIRDILERLSHDGKPAPELLREWLPDRWKPPAATANSS